MIDLIFEWDERKNSTNRKKHGISFEEARTAFFDENARVMPDPEHSDEEDRFVLLGSAPLFTYSLSATVIGRAMKSFG